MTVERLDGAPAPNRVPADAQRAFVGLLARPMVTPASDPELHRRVVRNVQQVADSARRLGYRLASVGRTVRLVRVPAAGIVTAPERPVDAPGRRVLALAFAATLNAPIEPTRWGVFRM